MSKQDEAGLILKLYELRRDPTMRQARDWFFRDFNPQSAADVMATMFSEKSGFLRMVMSYWDMAAALVNSGAIDLELFNETNGEHKPVFAKLEPIIGALRAELGPRFLQNLEKLIDDTPNGREELARIRERFKSIREQMAKRTATAT